MAKKYKAIQKSAKRKKNFKKCNESMNYSNSKRRLQKQEKKEIEFGTNKKEEYIKYKNKKNFKNIFAIIKIIIIIRIVPLLLNNELFPFESNFSKITLKIKDKGFKNILGYQNQSYYFDKAYFPNEVYINGELQNIVNYSYNFNQTINYVELLWNNTISNCSNMFRCCSDIIEFDFSNFDTSQVKNMYCMFYDCSSLTSLNLSSFNTSAVQDMSGMFQHCSSLTSLNLSNFDTSLVMNMEAMFMNCKSLTTLNISNFETSLVTRIQNMFYGCVNLEYINLKNFNEIRINNNSDHYKNIFNNIPNNIVICINEENTKNIILPQINNKKCKTIDCSDDWKSNRKAKIYELGECIESCEYNLTYKYEYNGKCYQKCPNGLMNNNSNICKCELEKCLLCPPVALDKDLCTKCNINYYQIENDPLNLGEYINCYKEPKGYYLDNNTHLYKKCYFTCETCEIKGDNITHNCLRCNANYNISITINNYSNCYNKCDYYHYYDNENVSHCVFSCPEDYPTLLEDKKECIKPYNNIYTELIETMTIIIETQKPIKNIEIINKIHDLINNKTNKTETKGEEEIKYYDTILENVESSFTSEDYDTSDLDKGKDEVIETEKMKITFTTTENQKNNNVSNNMTTIDLGECETLLKEFYNISKDGLLYMKKIDIVQEGMKIPKIEYDVYSKLSGNKLEKLNLSICSKTKISISIPIEIKGSLDKYNSSSGYYNDICYTTTSESGTDISLKDRKNEYSNKALCQEECDLSSYDYNINQAKCSCKAKSSSFSFADMNIDRSKLYESFTNIKNIANLNILKCYKQLFSKKGILINIGNYIIITIILLTIICAFIFYIKQFDDIINIINNIIYGISNIELIKKEKNRTNENNKNITEIGNDINNNKNKMIIKKKKQKKKKKKKKRNKNNNITIKNKISSDSNFKINNNIIIGNFINSNTNNNNNIIKDVNTGKVKNILEYKDDERNILSYELAIQYDKRSYCEYYISLLRIKNNLFFSFCGVDDYNSKIIKINIFFIGFSIYYAVNALFYNDDTMHKIYEDKGSFDFIYQLPQIIYSSIISLILTTILKLLALSNDSIIEFKQNKTKENLYERGSELEKKLRIRFITYFLVSFIFLLFFWYYISMFGAIYINTQFHLLKDTLTSFGLSFIYPFFIYLLPGLFRIPALSDEKKKRKYLYKFSKFLQFF